MCSRSGVATLSPTVVRGFSEDNGSWNTMPIRRRNAFAARPRTRLMSASPMWTEPAVGAIRPVTARATVLFPEPDSPTRPSTSPGATCRLTPEAACTAIARNRPR